MEIKVNSYRLVISSVEGDYKLNATLNIEGTNKRVEGGMVSDSNKNIATFYSNSDSDLNINYMGLSITEQQSLNTVINNFIDLAKKIEPSINAAV